MYCQVTVQILILLLFKTNTPTTGGLTTIFDQRPFGLDPTLVFVLSTSWSLLSCVRTHTKLISIDKGFCKITSQLFIFIWGTFATLRRVLSLVALFIPSMGLFSLLHHHQWDQVPFRVRQSYAVQQNIFSDDPIKLFGLNESINWSGLDRWSYTDPQHPTPPPVSDYTLMTLRQTFTAGAVLLILHIILLTLVKILISREFRRRGDYADKLVHILENVNYASPYSDWDEGDHSIQEYR